MGTGWRRAFCTTTNRDSESNISQKQKSSPSPIPSPSPRNRQRLGFLSGSSNPSTPRLKPLSLSSPSLRCSTTEYAAQTPNTSSKLTPKSSKSARKLADSNPSSPRSPLRLSLFRNSFKSRSNCGVCLRSVKTGRGTAIYTADCSHAFHFPCVAAHVRKVGELVCPVCNATWTDAPLLSIHKNLGHDFVEEPKNYSAFRPSRTLQDNQQLQLHTRPLPLASRFSDENGGEYDDQVDEFEINGRDLRSNVVQVRLLPESAVIYAGHSHETYAVALRVKAPPPPPLQPQSSSSSVGNVPLLETSHRVPIDLVTVLDLGGTMTGPKLEMLKRSMRLLISSLGSADRLSIVSYSETPRRLLPLKRMTVQRKRAAWRLVDQLVSGQEASTVAGEALRTAAKVLEDRNEKNPTASIMLLLDGQHERAHGNDTNQLTARSHDNLSRYAHIVIPIHSLGFGENRGYNQGPVEDGFAKCIGGLFNVVVQDLRVQLSFSSGSCSSPVEISAIYMCNELPTVSNSNCVRLGDLYAEEEKELLVELKIPTSAVGAHHTMSVRCLYKEFITQEVVFGGEQSLLVPHPEAVRSSAPKIERFRNSFITKRAVAESRRLIEQGDYASAKNLLASARALVVRSSYTGSDEYVGALEVELAELHWHGQQQLEDVHQMMMMIGRRIGSGREFVAVVDDNGEPLTPSSALRAAQKRAQVATPKKSLNSRVRARDLHGFENARF